ncbi:MAG: hypothetical protein ACM3SM_11810 [Bacteroidota bacterium]
MNSRDGMGIQDNENIQISAESDSEILLMEIPMTI